jgi:apolipoprotein N-acyltransferase
MLEKLKLKINKFLQNYPKFLAIISGSICALAFAPLNFFIVLLISLPILYFLLEENNSKKDIFMRGFCFGFGYFLSGIYWIAISLLVDAQKFAWLIPFALTIIPGFLALYFGFLAIAYRFIINKVCLKFHYQKILILAILWVIFEALRSTLFSGFSWNLLGYAWLFSIYSSQSASLFGVYFLSFLAVISALLPVILFDKKAIKADKNFAFITIFILLINFTFGFFTIKNSNIITHSQDKIRLVQANIKQEIKWQEDERYNNFLKHIELTRSMPLDNVKAVIWAETSIPYIIENDSKIMPLLKLAIPKDGELITGGLRVERSNKNEISKVFNSVFMINALGINATYDKHHLVPFGEYVPLQRFFSFLFIDEVIDKITGSGMGFSAGNGAQTLEAKHFSFNPLICYEVIFSREVVAKNQHPDLFINVTNDAWFGNSSGPYQHLAISQMRAIEYSTPLIRVAGTGVSASIDSNGNIVEKIDLNQEAVVDVELLKKGNYSFYHQYGNISLIFIFILIWFFIAKNFIIKYWKKLLNKKCFK